MIQVAEELYWAYHRPPIGKRERKQRVWRFIVLARSKEEAISRAMLDRGETDASQWKADPVGRDDSGERYTVVSAGLYFEERS